MGIFCAYFSKSILIHSYEVIIKKIPEQNNNTGRYDRSTRNRKPAGYGLVFT